MEEKPIKNISDVEKLKASLQAQLLDMRTKTDGTDRMRIALELGCSLKHIDFYMSGRYGKYGIKLDFAEKVIAEANKILKAKPAVAA